MRITKGKLRKYIENYKFNSLFFKNLMLLLVLIIVPLAGTVMLSYYAYGNMKENEIRVFNERVTADAYSDLERILKEARTELMYIGFNSNVELYMYDTDEIRELNYKVQSIQELIKLPVLSKAYIDSIYIYSLKNGRVITIQGISDFESFPDKEALDAYLSCEEGEAQVLITENNVKGYPRQQISIFQDVKYGSERNGITVMNLDIDNLAKEITVPEQVKIYLTDGKRILFSNEREMIGASVDKIPDYASRRQDDTVLGREYCLTSQYAGDTELEVLAHFGTQGYHNQLSAIRNVMMVFLLVMTVITLGLSAFISVRIFQPIGAIMSTIQENKNVLLGEEELFQEKNELEYVLGSIQKTAHIKKDVDEELSERVRLLKKAQAVALQSQINPHFLNNTLDTINWMAIGLLGGRNEISEMTGALSKMLRMSLENSDTIITVQTEIEHCMNYLEIQKKRYEDKFEVRWEIPKEVYDCKTIRVILQPIVENAIYHGIKHLSNKGLIVIGGRLAQGNVEISVEDNGLGMTPAELVQLQDNMRSNMIKESRHIGVTNVNQRLKLYFGEEYGVFIESREGVGTKVVCRFPQEVSLGEGRSDGES